MYAVVSPDKIQLPPGAVIRLLGTWQDYCTLCDSRGDSSIPRIKYRDGEILLMNPLPEHGREVHLLARVIEILLEKEAQNYEAFTPITIDHPKSGGIEPDYCFYIPNWQVAVGKNRLDWQIDLPPDLVIEIDVTSFTSSEDYLPYKVPEVWIYRKAGLTIYRLDNNKYQQTSTSLYFPSIDIISMITTVLRSAAQKGTGVALRELRNGR